MKSIVKIAGLVLLSFVVLMLASSCSKEASPISKLDGTWRTVENATDVNLIFECIFSEKDNSYNEYKKLEPLEGSTFDMAKYYEESGFPANDENKIYYFFGKFSSFEEGKFSVVADRSMVAENIRDTVKDEDITKFFTYVLEGDVLTITAVNEFLGDETIVYTRVTG